MGRYVEIIPKIYSFSYTSCLLPPTHPRIDSSCKHKISRLHGFSWKNLVFRLRAGLLSHRFIDGWGLPTKPLMLQILPKQRIPGIPGMYVLKNPVNNGRSYQSQLVINACLPSTVIDSIEELVFWQKSWLPKTNLAKKQPFRKEISSPKHLFSRANYMG